MLEVYGSYSLVGRMTDSGLFADLRYTLKVQLILDALNQIFQTLPFPRLLPCLLGLLERDGTSN